MAAGTAERVEQSFPLVGEVVGLGLRVGPARIIRRRHHHQTARHHGVIRSAILRAGEVEDAGLRGSEPEVSVAARQNVLLEPHRRQEEIVDHVLRGHHQTDRHVFRDVNLVDLPRAAGLLDAPHPLLGDHMDFHCVARNIECGKLVRGGPPEDEKEQEQSGRGPADLHVAAEALGKRSAPRVRPAPIAQAEAGDECCNQKGDQARDHDQDPECAVDLVGVVGRRGHEAINRHDGAPRRDIAFITTRATAMPNSVNIAASSSQSVIFSV